MPWRPASPGERPTLGWQVLDWMGEVLAMPDRSEYEPFIPTDEQARFILWFYEIDPLTGKRRYRRAVYSRPKGAGKSPLTAAIASAEALGPVVPSGWDAKGQPVGIEWAHLRTPWVQLAATSEDQTRNAWAPLLEMLRDGPACDLYPGLEPMETFVNLPKGRIEAVTAAATSREGNRPVFVAMDQVESWLPSNGGVKLAATLRRNLGKTSGSAIETPNAFVPGEESVAENTAKYADLVLAGKVKDAGLLYDHREAPASTDLADRESLLAGLRIAYGDATWVDLDRLVAEIWSPDTDPADARRYYLNQVSNATDAWLAHHEISAVQRVMEEVDPGEVITVGFDGSRERVHSKADATGLVGCRVRDGHLFTIACWEQPDGPAGKDWEVPVGEVEAAVATTFRKYRVAAFFADPAKGWRSHVNQWEGTYARSLVRSRSGQRVMAGRNHPFEWWLTGGRVTEIVRATKRLHDAIVNGEVTIDGSLALAQHLRNARRRASKQGIQIAKAYPESPNKIDLAVCALLALEARDQAIALGISARKKVRASYTF